MTEYWRLKSLPTPEGEEGYLFQSFTNGKADTEYWLPLVHCPKCDDWGYPRVFPFKCPSALKALPAIKSVPIPLEDYKKLSLVVQYELEKSGINSKLWMLDPTLGFKPGTEFADRIMEIPCHPKYSFFWPSTGANAVVTKEVKDAFEKNKFTGVYFQEVTLNWVGKFDTDKQKPSWDHMMWWMLEGCLIGSEKKYPGEKYPERFGPLYSMIVWNWAERSDIETKYPHCEACGRELRPEKSYRMRKNPLSHQILDYDLFRVPGVGLVISDRVRKAIEENGFTNRELTPLKVKKRD